MENIKWKIQDYLFLLLIIGLIAYLIVRIVLDRDEKKILNDCGFNVGTVEIFFYSANSRSPIAYVLKYKYDVDGIEFEGRKHSFVPREGVKIGDKYIVAYSNENVKNSVMLFEYSIKQEVDFEKNIEKFKVNPPQFRRY